MYFIKKTCSNQKCYSKMVLDNALCQFLNSLRRQYCLGFLNLTKILHQK